MQMNSIKSICIICPSLYPLLDSSIKIKMAGGAEAQLKTLGAVFRQKGYQVDYIVNDYGQPSKQIVDSITFHKVPFHYLGGSNFNLLPSWYALIKVLVQIKADIHFLKLPRHLVLPVGIFCKLFCKKLVFIGQIDTDVDLKFIRKSENFLSYFMYVCGMKFVYNTVAQNEFQKDGFKKIFRKKSMIIKNILTLPSSSSITKEGYILWVGNSSKKKQPELFVSIAQMLPHYKFKMIMSSSQERPDDLFIKKMSRSLSNFEYIGFVPFRKIMPYYQKAVLFVSTSLREGFPNTFLQSWQYRTPVVSLGIDPDGVIAANNLGMVCGNLDSLCTAISKIMDDSLLMDIMGDNSYQYVQNSHSPEAVFLRYEKLFKVASRKKRGSNE